MRMAANEYLETQVMTASRERLHLMVVDGTLRFVRQASAAIEVRDFSAAHLALGRARECVNELIISLNPKPDPALVDQLKGLFLFVHRNLVEADVTHDPQRLRDAIRILEMHRETWIALMEQLQQERATIRFPDRSEASPTSWLS